MQEHLATLLDDGTTGEPLPEEARFAALDLKARYFFYLDTKQWTKLRALFTDDACFEGFRTTEPDAFVRASEDLLGNADSAHQGFMPRFWVRSETVVQTRWGMYDYITWPPGSKIYQGDDSPQLSGFRGYGYYEELYQQTADGWRIAFMRLTRLRMERIYGPQAQTFQGVIPTQSWI